MARPKVYVTRMIPEEGIDLLRETCDVEVNPEPATDASRAPCQCKGTTGGHRPSH